MTFNVSVKDTHKRHTQMPLSPVWLAFSVMARLCYQTEPKAKMCKSSRRSVSQYTHPHRHNPWYALGITSTLTSSWTTIKAKGVFRKWLPVCSKTHWGPLACGSLSWSCACSSARPLMVWGGDWAFRSQLVLVLAYPEWLSRATRWRCDDGELTQKILDLRVMNFLIIPTFTWQVKEWTLNCIFFKQ